MPDLSVLYTRRRRRQYLCGFSGNSAGRPGSGGNSGGRGDERGHCPGGHQCGQCIRISGMSGSDRETRIGRKRCLTKRRTVVIAVLLLITLTDRAVWFYRAVFCFLCYRNNRIYRSVVDLDRICFMDHTVDRIFRSNHQGKAVAWFYGISCRA